MSAPTDADRAARPHSITALAGGVGAARFLRGLLQVTDPADVTVIVNTGDDDDFHGLRVCPDLDTVTYTLAGAENPDTGWGLVGETFATMGALERYGTETWFRLGDRDLATHLVRTRMLAGGATLSEATEHLRSSWGVRPRLLPMSDDPVRTRIELADGRDLAMQEWFVRERAEPTVAAVRFEGAERAAPAPGVLEAIASAETLLISPSNPVISIGPILAVPGIADALAARRDRVVGVSPLIAGRAVKGPADRMMRDLGSDANCVGVARAYAHVCSTLVIDTRDAEHSDEVAALGVRPVVTDTLMADARIAAALARETLAAVA